MNPPGTAGPVVRISPPQHCPERHDPRWCDWLTGAERAYALSLARAEEHLSARKAAKEAVARLLGWPGPPPWQDMEIRRRSDEAPSCASMVNSRAGWASTAWRHPGSR